VSFAAVTLCVASQRVLNVVYFVIDSVRKLLDTPSYTLLDLVWDFIPRVVTGEKNSPTVAHAFRKRRLKWVLPRLGVGAQG
jgi:hypothetical protein